MINLTLKLGKLSEWNAGLVFVFAAAPEITTNSSAAKDFGDIRFDLVANKALVSLGKREKISTEIIRRAGGVVAKWIAKNAIEAAGIDIPSLGTIGLPLNDAVGALTEGLVMGAFTFSRYKSVEKSKPAAVDLLINDDQLQGEIETVFNRAVIIGDAVNLSREWAHEPPNVINPVSLAERVQQLALDTGLRCLVFDEKQLADMGAGGIVAVGKGSNTPSRLIVLEYAGKSNAEPVALIGKALTMDTGGYSLKTTDGMVGMKYDKCGGMTVIATLVAAARLGIKTPLVGVIAAAENMVSGESYRPNDIIHTMSGKTVEIISTDAEGRMVLCDALTFTQKNFKPRAMVDLATLTGAVLVALGTVRAGLLSNNDSLAQALSASGERTFERLWRLPMDEEYFDLIKGDDSDIKNSSGVRAAGTIVGGIFLKQFVSDEVPWAHLDIAGMASPDKDGPYTPKGASGFGVRLLVDYLSGFE